MGCCHCCSSDTSSEPESEQDAEKELQNQMEIVISQEDTSLDTLHDINQNDSSITLSE